MNEPQKVTPAQIEAEIEAEYSTTLDRAYSFAPLVEGLDRVTIHTIVLRNGAKLVGVNYGAIVPANHSDEEGRKQARAAAFDQAWPLFGFRLRDQLHEQDVRDFNEDHPPESEA